MSAAGAGLSGWALLGLDQWGAVLINALVARVPWRLINPELITVCRAAQRGGALDSFLGAALLLAAT